MLNSPNIPKYAHMATLVNYMYASKHGYNFVVHRCPLSKYKEKEWMWGDGKNEYLFVWSKASIINKYLKQFDIVFFIDSDAIFVDQKISIEKFIEENFSEKTKVAMAEDCVNKNQCWFKDKENTRYNSGSLLFINSPEAFQLLNEWNNVEKNCSEYKWEHPYDQSCLNKVIHKKPYNLHFKKPFHLSEKKDYIYLAPYHKMNGRDGEWIQHYMFCASDEREKKIKKVLSENLLQFIDHSIVPSSNEKYENYEPYFDKQSSENEIIPYQQNIQNKFFMVSCVFLILTLLFIFFLK